MIRVRAASFIDDLPSKRRLFEESPESCTLASDPSVVF
jgi:hypothetical protein